MFPRLYVILVGNKFPLKSINNYSALLYFYQCIKLASYILMAHPSYHQLYFVYTLAAPIFSNPLRLIMSVKDKKEQAFANKWH